jgi:hypothetical protein
MFEFPQSSGLDLENSLTRHTWPPLAIFLGGELTFTTVAETIKFARDRHGWVVVVLAAFPSPPHPSRRQAVHRKTFFDATDFRR